MHVRVDVHMYLIFVMTGQNISNDSDKVMQICISPTFIEPCFNQGNEGLVMHQCWMHASDTDGRTDRFRDWRARRNEN